MGTMTCFSVTVPRSTGGSAAWTGIVAKATARAIDERRGKGMKALLVKAYGQSQIVGWHGEHDKAPVRRFFGFVSPGERGAASRSRYHGQVTEVSAVYAVWKRSRSGCQREQSGRRAHWAFDGDHDRPPN